MTENEIKQIIDRMSPHDKHNLVKYLEHIGESVLHKCATSSDDRLIARNQGKYILISELIDVLGRSDQQPISHVGI